MRDDGHLPVARGRGARVVDEPLLDIVFSAPAPGVLLVAVGGKLDLASAPELDARVRYEMQRRKPRRLLLDLAHLGFLGLHGVAVFDRLRRHAVRAGIDLGLVALRPAGRRALEFAGVLPAFDRYPDVATALAAAGRSTRAATGRTRWMTAGESSAEHQAAGRVRVDGELVTDLATPAPVGTRVVSSGRLTAPGLRVAAEQNRLHSGSSL